MVLISLKFLSLLLVATKVLSQTTDGNEAEVTKTEDVNDSFIQAEKRFQEAHYIAKSEENEQSSNEAKSTETTESNQQTSSQMESQQSFSELKTTESQQQNTSIETNKSEKENASEYEIVQNEQSSSESNQQTVSHSESQQSASESKSSETENETNSDSKIYKKQENESNESKVTEEKSQQSYITETKTEEKQQSDSKSETEQRNIAKSQSEEKLASKSGHKNTEEVKKMISELERAIILETELEQMEKQKPESEIGTEFTNQPNIVVIMADDMGWNDVSYHGSDQILTSNIDVMAFEGKILQQYYTDTYGTASRSAFLTGQYPSKLGTQSQSIRAFEDRGLPVKEKLLPGYLKELGYITHLVGKWGLGKSRDLYLPTNRGFDSFYGYLDNSVDYYTYNHIEHWNNTELCGIDLYHNLQPAENVKGHLTDVLTDHAIQLIREHDKSVPLYLQLCHAAPHAGGGLVNLQPPIEAIEANAYITHSARRLYAGMVTHLDKSMGHVIAALAETDILQNTIVVFVSDSGAAPIGNSQNFGTNLPLRGLKGTPWEGGVRSAAVVWHSELLSDSWDGLFHVTDWLPTLVAAAGGNVTADIDGVNQWDALRYGLPSNRKDLLVTIDDLNGFAAIREGDYKFIVGNVNLELSNYYGNELTDVRFNPPSYEASLLECETARVFKETLYRDLDMNSVWLKRNESNLNRIEKADDKNLCMPTIEKGCLFNVKLDPTESHDLWNSSANLIKHLTLRLRTLWAEMTPRQKAIPDDRSNPSYHHYAWSPFLANDEPMAERLTTPAEFPLKVSLAELQYLVDINLDAFKVKVLDSIQNMGNSFVKSIGGLFNFKF